jgi:hypothetical protein
MDLEVIWDNTLYKVLKEGEVIFVSPLSEEVENFVKWKMEADRSKTSGCSSC